MKRWDVRSRALQWLESIVREQRDKGTTILFSTHLMEQAECA